MFGVTILKPDVWDERCKHRWEGGGGSDGEDF